MNILVNQPLTTTSDIYLCDSTANIHINANLITVSGDIYIIGKNIIVNAHIHACNGKITILRKETLNITENGALYSQHKSIKKQSSNPQHFQNACISHNIAQLLISHRVETIEKKRHPFLFSPEPFE